MAIFSGAVKYCSTSMLNDAGKIEPAEVKESLLRLGVNIDLAEAKRLTQRFVYCTVHVVCLR